MVTSSKNIRHKNVDRQMLHEDLLRASEILRIKKTEYLAMCGLGSEFDKDLVRGRRNPTEYLLRHIARTLRKGGIKRNWKDYIIEGPVQMEMDTDALKSAPVEPQEMSLQDRLSLAIGLLQQIEHELKGNQGIAKA